MTPEVAAWQIDLSVCSPQAVYLMTAAFVWKKGRFQARFFVAFVFKNM